MLVKCLVEKTYQRKYLDLNIKSQGKFQVSRPVSKFNFKTPLSFLGKVFVENPYTIYCHLKV